jgi:NAD dependent epimerase/dehydratase family enzyme
MHIFTGGTGLIGSAVVAELLDYGHTVLVPIFAADQPSSSTYTRKTLGWEPTHSSLLEDLEHIQP